MTIGEKIYKLRNEAHMTQEELAGEMGVSRQSVSKWESGASVPELEKLRMLADLFGIPIGELIDPEETAKAKEAEAGSGSEENPREASYVALDMDVAKQLKDQQDQIDFLKKKIKSQKKASIIQGICIIVLTATILINSFTMAGMNRRIREAQDTANEAFNNSNKVTYVTSDFDDSSRDFPFEDAYEEIESFDADAHTMLVNFTVIPQSTTEETDISLILTDENGLDTEIALEDNNSRYTAQAELPILDYPDALIVMDDGDARQIYQTSFDRLMYLEDELLPSLKIDTDLMPLNYKANKQTLSGDGILYLSMDSENEAYYSASKLTEAYELDQLTVRIVAEDPEDGSLDGSVLWEESLDADQLKELEDPQNTVELDIFLENTDYHGEMLYLQVELTNHYLQEEQTFTSDVSLEYGADSEGHTFVLEENAMGLVMTF